MSEARRKAADSAIIVLAATLFPLVRRMERLRIPTTAGAVLVVLGALLVVGLVGLALGPPVRDLAEEVPKSVAKARSKADAIRARIMGMMDRGHPATRPDSSRAGQPPSATPQQGPTGAAPSPPVSTTGSAATHVLGVTTSLLTEAVEEILLVFFLLAAGHAWTDKLARMARSSTARARWPEIAGEMRDVVGHYLFVTLLINLGQAVVIGLAAWAVGMPTPLLWAMLTFVAEWVPYLGGLTMVALLLLAGLADNQSIARALLMPGIYLVVTTLQNNLVSPIAYGRGLRLNPTSILVAVMLFYFMWGVAGAFLAVPIVAALRVLASRVSPLEPLSIALEE